MLIGDIYQFPAVADYNDGGQMLLCDGRAISRTGYAVLFALCGIAFGPGDGATTFNIPNFCNDGAVTGRTPIGADPAGGGYALGATGGVQAHLHTCAGVNLLHEYDLGATDTGPNLGAVNVEGAMLPLGTRGGHTHPLPSLAAVTHTGFPNTDNQPAVAPYLAMGIFIKAT